MFRNAVNRNQESQKIRAGEVTNKTNIYTENLCFFL